MPITTPQPDRRILSLRLSNVRTNLRGLTEADCDDCGQHLATTYPDQWGSILVMHASACNPILDRQMAEDMAAILRPQPRMSRVYLVWAIAMVVGFALLFIFGGH